MIEITADESAAGTDVAPRGRHEVDARQKAITGSGDQSVRAVMGATRLARDIGPLERMVAGAVLLVLLFKVPGFTLMPFSVFLALLLLPVTFSVMKLVPRLRALGIATIAAAVFGIVLRLAILPAAGTPDSAGDASETVLWMAAFPLILLLGIWALIRVRLRTGLLLMFSGATVSTVLNAGSAQTWKGTLGFYVTLLLLSALAGRPMVWTRLVLVAAVILNVASDARTMALVALITLLCTLVPRQALHWVRDHSARAAIIILASFAALTIATVNAMQSGLLGRAIQQRTLDQMRDGQNIITGGRTEWAASLNLMATRPEGFGVGVVVAPGLQTHALNAVESVGGDYRAEYFRTDVFGVRTDLHSSFADLWFHFGLGGVAVAVILLISLLVALPRALAHGGRGGTIGTIALFAVLAALWDVLFSPMANSDRIITGVMMAAICALYLTKERLPVVRNDGAIARISGDSPTVAFSQHAPSAVRS